MSDETQQYPGMTDVEQRPDPTFEAPSDTPNAPRPVRGNVVRDGFAAVLLLLALTVPWNVSFGLGVPNNTWWLFAVVVGATMLALVALAASHLSASEAVDKVRLGLTAPYVLVVLGFVGFAVYDFVRLTGGGATAPGIGPGVLVGVAGALLAAQPVLKRADDRRRFVGWFLLASRVASWSKFFVTVSVALTLYLRTRDVLPNVFDASIAWPSITAVLTAVAYGAVAVTAVWIGLRWMQQEEMDAGLATIALGAATVIGSILVWFVPLGRDVDAFHGIAQATSTAGVGYEGYLAWAIGAAIFAPAILWQAFTARSLQPNVWHDAVRKCLLLIAVWCAGTAVLQIFDVVVELAGGVPFSTFDSALLFVFDLASAALAYWVRANVGAASEHQGALSRLSGVLVVVLVCRVVLGVGLASNIVYAAPTQGLDTAVYGNTLAHQLTSTFDVVLCLLALAVLALLVVLQRRRGQRDAGESAPAVTSAAAAVRSAAAVTTPEAVTSAETIPVAQAAPGAEAAAAPLVPPVPPWQAPSQWAALPPHAVGAPEPQAEAAALEPPAAEEVAPSTELLPALVPEQAVAPEQEEAGPIVDVAPDLPTPADQPDEFDESSSAATAYVSSGRHRHRLPQPESTDSED